MASTKTGRNALPRSQRRFYDQADVQTRLRYGAQESALGSILEQLTRDYGRQAQAQQTAGQTVLGAYTGANQGVTQTYNDVGLTPNVLASIASSPTGQRLAGEVASYKAANDQQARGIQAGQQYLQQHIADQYSDDVGKVTDQLQSLTGEKGLYQSSLLDQLITGDRSARHDANVAAAKQRHDDEQAILDRQQQQENALIGQGLLPGKDGALQPLPGGKADPNAQKKKGGFKPATRAAQSKAATDFSRALSIINTYVGDDPKDKALRREIGQKLLNGEAEIKGEPVYDTRREIKKGVPNPNYGKPLLNPDGTAKTTDSLPGIPKIENQPIVSAALDMVFDGHLSPATVRKLHDLGYKVRGLSGVKTRADVPKPKRNPPRSKAPSGKYYPAG